MDNKKFAAYATLIITTILNIVLIVVILVNTISLKKENVSWITEKDCNELLSSVGYVGTLGLPLTDADLEKINKDKVESEVIASRTVISIEDASKKKSFYTYDTNSKTLLSFLTYSSDYKLKEIEIGKYKHDIEKGTDNNFTFLSTELGLKAHCPSIVDRQDLKNYIRLPWITIKDDTNYDGICANFTYSALDKYVIDIYSRAITDQWVMAIEFTYQNDIKFANTSYFRKALWE